MTRRAHGHDVGVVLGGVAEVVIVFVAALTFAPHVAAVDARELVRVRASAGADVDVHALAGLRPVPIPRRSRGGAGAARARVQAEGHHLP